MAGLGRRLRARRVAALALAGALAPPAAATPFAHAVLDRLFGDHAVRIVRTAHGVAHVQAEDEEGLGYGIGYAHAQDDVCATAELLVTARGERSFWFGGEVAGELGARALPNRVIDAFVRAHMDDVKLALAWSGASADARARLRGVVEGYDHYLFEHRDRLPAACAGKPWVKDATEAEWLRLGELAAIQAGVGAWADAVVAAQPPRPDGVPARPDWLPDPPVDEATRPAASSVVAFGRDASRSGRGLLLAAAQGPWSASGLSRFWQVHLTIPGRLDAMGATAGPLPWLAIGFNRSVAWSQAASAGHRFTLHELALVPGNPTSYLVDGKPEPMTPRPVRVSGRGADGQYESTPHTVWTTRYGPVVVLPTRGLLWTPAVAYALQDPSVLDTRYADTWAGMERAANVGELRDALLQQQGMAWSSTVAADRGGFVLYADASRVPDVGEARVQGCRASRQAARLGPGARVTILDGSRSACDIAPDPASRAPGAVAPRRLPSMLRSDWIQDSGSGGWLANPMSPLSADAPLVGTPVEAQRLDTRHWLHELAARLGGADGSAPVRPIDADELSALFWSQRDYAATLVLDDLLAACRTATSASTRAGCAALAAWDRTDAAGARGAAVFREFWRRARVLPDLWRVPFDHDDPVETPHGLALGDASGGTPAQQALRSALFDALADAVQALRGAGFALDAPLGALQVHASPGGPVALGGAEAATGAFAPLEARAITPLTRRGYDLDGGAAYLQLVDFDEDGPVARGLLVHGQSSDPASPLAFDQLPDFAARRWLPLPFRAGDVEAQRVGEAITLHFRSEAPTAPMAPTMGR